MVKTRSQRRQQAKQSPPNVLWKQDPEVADNATGERFLERLVCTTSASAQL